MAEIWTELDLRIGRSLEDVARAREAVGPLLSLRWQSRAGVAFRNSVIGFLVVLDTVPRMLEDARTAVQQGRASSLEAACRTGVQMEGSPHGTLGTQRAAQERCP